MADLKYRYCRRRGRGGHIEIKPRFLPRGYRFLEPCEEVEKDDWYWSHTHKCYLPVAKKRGGWGGAAGKTIPFIRRR